MTTRFVGVLIVLTLSTLAGCIGCATRTVADKRQEAKPAQLRVADIPVGEGGQYKVSFINESYGWLAQGQRVWRTTNGGANWSLVFVANQPAEMASPPSLNAISNLEFVSLRVGFLQAAHEIYKSEDGGDTWIRLRNLPLDEPTCFTFLSDGKQGWVGGESYIPISIQQARNLPKEEIAHRNGLSAIRGIIYGTQDGGNTWRRQPLPKTFGSIESLCFYNDRHGLALGLYQVLYTDDGGRRWKEADFKNACVDEEKWRASSDDRNPISVFATTNLGWLVFKDGYMARSTDGGRSWCDFRQPGDVKFESSYEVLSSIHFIDSEHGFGLAGYRLYQTSDGGKTWTKHPLDARIDALTFANVHGWAVGSEGLFRISP